mmetsp:Transcript_16364/g.16527  ORF Transcript_16364/g.16527 Transcript_16364/m.16527 type:complete len:97 (+) Transcript_16364:1541-1831(+)
MRKEREEKSIFCNSFFVSLDNNEVVFSFRFFFSSPIMYAQHTYFSKCDKQESIMVNPVELVGAGRRPFLTFLRMSHLRAYKSTVVGRTSLLMIKSS